MSHTPGPWKWWTSNSFLRLSSESDGKDGGVICPIVSRSDGHPDLIVKREDMALIAAAPELLEALEVANQAMSKGRNASYEEFYGAVNKARAAITKATGTVH